MVLKEEQLRKIRWISDSKLYDQAVTFMREFERQKRRTIPSSQLNGLLNITRSGTYADVWEFVEHQQERTWPERSAFMKPFYVGLAEELKKVEQLTVKEFRLTGNAQQDAKIRSDGFKELMLLMSREFIQHLAAENGYIEAERKMR